jgi:hypothetical protein
MPPASLPDGAPFADCQLDHDRVWAGTGRVICSGSLAMVPRNAAKYPLE